MTLLKKMSFDLCSEAEIRLLPTETLERLQWWRSLTPEQRKAEMEISKVTGRYDAKRRGVEQ